jgi:hypothetical protein
VLRLTDPTPEFTAEPPWHWAQLFSPGAPVLPDFPPELVVEDIIIQPKTAINSTDKNLFLMLENFKLQV